MGEKKKYSEFVLEEREKGNVVFIAIPGEVMSAPVKDIVAQPVDGLLWDLNRDEAIALTFMDREGMIHWVNNFAVALVIRELKSQVAKLETRSEALEEDRDTIAEWLSKALDRNADKLEADSKHLDAILQFFRDDGFDEDIVYSISKYCEKHGLPIND